MIKITLADELRQLERIEHSSGKESGRFWTKQLETKVDYRRLIESYLPKSFLLQERIETGKTLVELVRPAFEEALDEYKIRLFTQKFSSERYRLVRQDLMENLLGYSARNIDRGLGLPSHKIGFLTSYTFTGKGNIVPLILASTMTSGTFYYYSQSLDDLPTTIGTTVAIACTFFGIVLGISRCTAKAYLNFRCPNPSVESPIVEDLNYIDNVIKKYFEQTPNPSNI